MKLSLMVFTMLFGANVHADTNQDLMDINTDVEEMTADSEAANAQAKAAAIRLAKEKEETARAMQEAIKARALAEAKRVDARKALKRTENEMKPLLAQQAKLKAEMQKLEQQNLASEKTIVDSNARVEKLKKEIVAAEELKAQKLAKTQEVNKQRDEIVTTMKSIEKQHALVQAEYKVAADNEKAAIQKLEKTTVEETQRKNQLAAEITKMKEKYRRIKANIAAMEAESEKMKQQNIKSEQLVETGRHELQTAIREEAEAKGEVQTAPVVAAPSEGSSLNADLVLKRDCNVRLQPDRAAKFLGVKRAGTAVTKTEELKEWVQFSQNSQKVYLLKNCFQEQVANK